MYFSSQKDGVLPGKLFRIPLQMRVDQGGACLYFLLVEFWRCCCLSPPSLSVNTEVNFSVELGNRKLAAHRLDIECARRYAVFAQ